MSVVIVDYGVGNLGSIPNMLDRIGVLATITDDPATIAEAKRLILPGVGAFDAGMRSLDERGLREPLRRRVLVDRVPTLALCLGMHLLFEGSEEGSLPGLGWLSGRVVRFDQRRMDAHLPVPNMGWHELRIERDDPIVSGLADAARFYYAHSFHAQPADPSLVVATAHYGYGFASIVRSNAIIGAQFHPEKSHRFGLQFLSNFVSG
jgi:glutamine amidotransferase